jgi:UDP-N-acetylmuramoylalanine--D-glutamate ligase
VTAAVIDLSSLFDGPVAVLGLGRSGLVAAEALAAANLPVWAWDDNAEARAVARNRGLPLMDLADCDLGRARALVISPGVPHTFPAPHPVAARAKQAGCPMIGDLELLIRARPEATFVGVTGTNGKSTTTALIGHLLAAAGRASAVGGNIGVPALSLPALAAGAVYVLELSSYQLEITPSLACDVAVLLNVTPDHLARHGGMDGYVAAKRTIFRGQPAAATAVVGVDDDVCRGILDGLMAERGSSVVAVSGRDEPTAAVFAAGGRLFERIGSAPAGAVVDLTTAPTLPGDHNAQNAAAAYAAARALGLPAATVAAAMATFAGLPHRQERVAVINGVTYVNDSKATNPEAAAKALACYGSVYWIAGGRPKEGDLSALYPLLDRVRHAFLIGEATGRFAGELAGRVAVTRCGTLADAVAAARARAEGNGATEAVVLLSPACASFDQFADFEARGDAYRAAVESLAS